MAKTSLAEAVQGVSAGPEQPEEGPPAAGPPPRAKKPLKVDPVPAAPLVPGERARLCKQLERAPEGSRRFKIRALTDSAAISYVLAADRAAAEAEYRRAHGYVADVKLTVTALTD